MKDFLLLFRMDYSARQNASPEQMQASMQLWMDWLGSIAAQDKLIDRGNRLEYEGKVVAPGGVVTDGPYTDVKESLGGYSLIKAASLEEAAELAKGCPVLHIGGTVEVREIGKM